MTARQQGRKNVFTAWLIVAVTLPIGACLTAAEQAQEIAASDDAACRDAGTKPGTPAYAKCREDMSNRAANVANRSAYRHAESDLEPARALITPDGGATANRYLLARSMRPRFWHKIRFARPTRGRRALPIFV
jgi:hypothetical protein